MATPSWSGPTTTTTGTSGAVYVFRTTDGGATYDQVAKLTAAGTTSFGRSVAIAGATIVVGAHPGGKPPTSSTGTSDGGATYVDLSKLMADDRGDRRSLQAVSAGEFFGYSVAIDGATVVVGAYNDGNTGPVDGSGSAYVFGANVPTPQPTTSRPTTPEIDYAPSAAPSEAPTFATYVPTPKRAPSSARARRTTRRSTTPMACATARRHSVPRTPIAMVCTTAVAKAIAIVCETTRKTIKSRPTRAASRSWRAWAPRTRGKNPGTKGTLERRTTTRTTTERGKVFADEERLLRLRAGLRPHGRGRRQGLDLPQRQP